MIAWLRRRWSVTPQPSTRSTPRRTRLGLEEMEARTVPTVLGDPFIAIPHYDGPTDATVQLQSAVDQSSRIPPITPFPGFHGPLAVAVGDVNGDGIADLIVGAQAPNGHVKVFDGATGSLLQSFFAFPGFNGAVNVGAADVNGDGLADVLVSASATNAHVKAFSGADGSLLSSFFAFPGFYGTTAVTGADFNNSGHDQIVVGAGGLGVGGRVAVFNADGSVYTPGFFAFPGFDGPISVAAGDVTGDGVPDIIVGAGKGAPGGEVEVFSGADFTLANAFLPYAPTVTNGVNVQLADANQDGALDIIVTLQGGGNPGLSVFYGASSRPVAPGVGGSGTDSSPDPNGGTPGDFPYCPPDLSVPIPAPITPDPGTPPTDPGSSDPSTPDCPTDPGPSDPSTPGNPPDPGFADPNAPDPNNPGN